MSYLRSIAWSLAAAAGVAAASSAQAVTLADLIGGGPVVSGDKVFTNFNYLSATMPANQVAVNFVPSQGVQFGAGWNTAYAGVMDSVIGYTVSVRPGTNAAIAGVGLSFAGVIAQDGGVATVGESVTNPNNNQRYNLSVISDGSGPIADRFTDSVTVNPATTSLVVVKDISVTPVKGNAASFASVTFVDNTFVQVPSGGTPPVIPEPMSLALLPLALVGLGLRRKFAR